MRFVVVILAMAMTLGCSGLAGAAKNGEIKLAVSDVSASTDWSGRERDCMIAGVIANYQKGFLVKSHRLTFVGDLNYSQQKNDIKRIVSADDVRLRIDHIYSIRKDITGCASIKSLTHIKSADYVYYLKTGIAKADGFELMKGSSNTTVRVAYVSQVSASYRMTNSGDSLGILGELDGSIQYQDWSLAIRNSSVFMRGLDNNTFEIPITIEYSPSIVFVNYDILVRGNNQKAGFLRTLKVGVMFGF